MPKQWISKASISWLGEEVSPLCTESTIVDIQHTFSMTKILNKK